MKVDIYMYKNGHEHDMLNNDIETRNTQIFYLLIIVLIITTGIVLYGATTRKYDKFDNINYSYTLIADP